MRKRFRPRARPPSLSDRRLRGGRGRAAGGAGRAGPGARPRPPGAPPADAPPVSPVATPRAWDAAEPRMYPDPDIVALDRVPPVHGLQLADQAAAHRHVWAEGPAWNGVGRYLVWSDIPTNVQLRWLEDDGHVSVFRNPAGNSNGNTFDFEGRQISCEHGNRRVVRYEPNGKVTVLADKFDGKRLNAPNDVVVHPDGGIWFTDPGYGSRGNYEGNKAPSEIKEAVYRIDPRTGTIEKVARAT